MSRPGSRRGCGSRRRWGGGSGHGGSYRTCHSQGSRSARDPHNRAAPAVRDPVHSAADRVRGGVQGRDTGQCFRWRSYLLSRWDRDRRQSGYRADGDGDQRGACELAALSQHARGDPWGRPHLSMPVGRRWPRPRPDRRTALRPRTARRCPRRTTGTHLRRIPGARPLPRPAAPGHHHRHYHRPDPRIIQALLDVPRTDNDTADPERTNPAIAPMVAKSFRA